MWLLGSFDRKPSRILKCGVEREKNKFVDVVLASNQMGMVSKSNSLIPFALLLVAKIKCRYGQRSSRLLGRLKEQRYRHLCTCTPWFLGCIRMLGTRHNTNRYTYRALDASLPAFAKQKAQSLPNLGKPHAEKTLDQRLFQATQTLPCVIVVAHIGSQTLC